MWHRDSRSSVIFLVMLSLLLSGVSLGQAESLPVIPKPAQQSQQEGIFSLSSKTTIAYAQGLESEAQFLAAAIEQTTQLSLQTISTSSTSQQPGARLGNSSIRLVLAKPSGLKPEAYRLQVSPQQITLEASRGLGIFWGIQTLQQLIQPGTDWHVPACTISDSPRFAWRGVMLDVGRHLYPLDKIKRLVDTMALHKLNVLHWHLTEDQGWRIEIKKYPKLTEVGAWRDSSPPYGDRKASDGTRYGGFYTQEEIKELVAYAAQRHITIVPEIDMPGHMAAAIASYPWLGNDDIANFKPGVATSWGVHPFTLAPKEETFQWIDDVLTEVCELFPSQYIHIGGDEAPKTQWLESAFALSMIKRDGLKDAHELQSRFIQRVEQILSSKGRKLIGWNEIREGGLCPGVTVMAWQSWDSAVDSVREGHDVVMAPKTHTYLDYYQSSPDNELLKAVENESIGGYLPLAKVYDFDPIPGELRGTQAAEHILGCQAQLWTEYAKTWDKLEYMAFPRLSALAESAWSSPAEKDYEDFLRRLKPMLERLRSAGVRCFDPFEPVDVNAYHHAVISTTLPGYGGSLPEMAYDGDRKTYFQSSRAVTPEDHFTVTFKSPRRPVVVQVVTGSSEFSSREKKWGNSSEDALQLGVLEAYVERRGWVEVAQFKDGKAHATLPKKWSAISIRPTQPQQGERLVINEILIRNPKPK